MKQIQYIPEIFHQVKIDEVDRNSDLIFDPKFDFMKIDSLIIEIPTKITYCRNSEDARLSIPIIFVYMLSVLQKANNEDSYKYEVYIKNLSDSSMYQGRIIINLDGLVGSLLLKESERKKEYYKKVRERKISNITASGGGLTADLLQFVNIPITSGRYEVYMTYFGLESNHEIVEIVLKD